MTRPSNGSSDRWPWRKAAALTLAMALAVSCSAQGTGDAARSTPERSTTSTTATPDETEAGDTPTTSPSDTAELPDDVPDEVFPGQGDPRIDIEHYEVEVTSDPDEPEIEGMVTITLRPTTEEPLPAFTLDLNGPTVSAATIDGADVEVTDSPDDDEGEIVLTPEDPLLPDETIDLRLAYAGIPEPTTFPDLGVPVGWQPDDQGGWFTMSEPDGTSTWVPVSEHPSDKATWTITLDTPSDTVGVANGRLVSKERAEGRRRWVWDTDEPMASYLVVVAVGDYDLVERPGPGDTEALFAFPRSVGEEDRAGFGELDEIMAFYADTFGGYPDDDTGAIVVATNLSLALETQTRPLFGLDGLGGDKVWALAHELAHQWYGNAVSPATWEDLWLNESFATYADWLYQEQNGGRSLRDSADQAAGASTLAVLDVDAAVTFDPAIYVGGARALYALRLTVGDGPFAEILERWFTENDGTSVATEDFIALAEGVSGEDLEPFVDDWLRSPEQPDLPG